MSSYMGSITSLSRHSSTHSPTSGLLLRASFLLSINNRTNVTSIKIKEMTAKPKPRERLYWKAVPSWVIQVKKLNIRRKPKIFKPKIKLRRQWFFSLWHNAFKRSNHARKELIYNSQNCLSCLLFLSHFSIFCSYAEVSIANEGLQNLEVFL